jgi:hypothetical protein
VLVLDYFIKTLLLVHDDLDTSGSNLVFLQFQGWILTQTIAAYDFIISVKAENEASLFGLLRELNLRSISPF